MVDFRKNKWKYSTIGLMGFLAILVIPGAIFPQANAVADTTQLTQQILNIVRDIQAKVNDSTFGLQAIKNAIGTSQTSVGNVQTDVTTIKTNEYVPFLATLSDIVVCVPHGTGFNGDHKISISSAGTLMLTSVIIRPNDTLSNTDDVVVAFVTINGNEIFLPGAHLGPSGTSTDAAFDIMGNGDRFPDQIAGTSIKFGLFCSHDSNDPNVSFKKIVVSGWKRAGDTVTVDFP